MTESQPTLYSGPLDLRDLYEILRLPVLFALIAIAATWVVWYLTNTSCPMDLAQITGCNPSQTARYINLDSLNKMVTHAAIAGGSGGIWSYAMTTRQRKLIEALEHQLTEERERAAEEREQAAERAAEEREQAAERAAEEREQAAEERRQLLATIETLTERLLEQQNGNNGGSAA